MQHLLLLHGAIGSMDQFENLKKQLSHSFKVHCINFSGHGGNKIDNTAFSIKLFSEDVLEYLQVNNIEKINIFGYSMGGYVGMYLAKQHPEKIDKLITLATKFYWDETVAEKETKMLDAEKIEIKLPDFANTLKERHQPQNWKLVLQKTAGMLSEMGKVNSLKPEDYMVIKTPVKLMIGDRDKMVTLNETLEVYHNLPAAQVSILPNTAHPIEGVDAARLGYEIKDFLKQEPPPIFN